MRPTHRILLTLPAFALLGACLEEEGGTNTPPPPPAPNLTVEGTWSLTGRGQRDRCNDGLFDGRFELDALPLEVVQTPSPIGPDTLLLADPDAFAPLNFSGTVTEDDVSFTAVEPIGDGQQQSFRFSGTVVGVVITGTISGSGPEGCDVAGTFEVTIVPPPTPDAGPQDGGPDGGPTDGGPGDPMAGDPSIMGDPSMTMGDLDPGMGDPMGDPNVGMGDFGPGDPTLPPGDDDEDRRPTIVTKALESCSSTPVAPFWAILLVMPLLRRRR